MQFANVILNVSLSKTIDLFYKENGIHCGYNKKEFQFPRVNQQTTIVQQLLHQ